MRVFPNSRATDETGPLEAAAEGSKQVFPTMAVGRGVLGGAGPVPRGERWGKHDQAVDTAAIPHCDRSWSLRAGQLGDDVVPSATSNQSPAPWHSTHGHHVPLTTLTPKHLMLLHASQRGN